MPELGVLEKVHKWIKKSPPLQVLALVLAGPIITALIVFLVQSVLHGSWTVAMQGTQLQILREAIAYSFVILLIIIAALTAGLIRGFKLGFGGASAEVDLADEHDKAGS